MRGQSAIEAMTSIGFVMIFFVATLAVVSNKDRETDNVREFLIEKTECDKLVMGADSAFASGRGMIIQTSLEHNATVYGEYGSATVGSALCIGVARLTNGTHNNFTVSEGDVEIVSLGDEVLIRNV